jgi:hypothetical protein
MYIGGMSIAEYKGKECFQHSFQLYFGGPAFPVIQEQRYTTSSSTH